jgi:hypothetical protein
MHSTTQAPQQVFDYGIAYADNFYTLSELVKAQLKKGFQPCVASGVQQMQHGEQVVFVQVMVKYQQPVIRKPATRPASKPTGKKK